MNGSSILRILKTQGLAPEIPEDLYHLIKKVHPAFYGRLLLAFEWLASGTACTAWIPKP